MTTRNGKVAPEVAEAAVKGQPEPWRPKMYALDADELTTKDMKRARVVLGGRNPWELLEEPEERWPLLIWCLKSRHIPGFTWEQAEDTPFGEFRPAGAPPPPQGETSSSPTSNSRPSGESDSSAAPPSVEAASSSASSSA